MSVLRATNLAIKFALEVAAVVAFAFWGTSVSTGAVAVGLAITAPLVAIALWARFAAPTSESRLRLGLRVPFELAVFALAALALLTSSSAAAIAFTSTVIVNSLSLTVLHQWEA